MVDGDDAERVAEDELRVQAWAEVRHLLEQQLEPLGRRALSVLAPQPGEHALDIGCGGGATTMALAEVVAPDGSVIGIDVSAAVLAYARQLGGHGARVKFVEADAQIHAFKPAMFDVAFSRFGVMFFEDPVVAFCNLHRSLKPGGRLAFVCWRGLEENPLDLVPLKAAADHLPSGWPQSSDDAPGPFSLANSNRIRDVLESAGFAEIEIEAFDEKVGCGDVDAMLAVAMRLGALGSILRKRPELRSVTQPLVRSALMAHDGPDGVRLKAATWIVSARR